ncbi:choice-of-anchor L domain-containing protein [Microbacterium telephonicum]|uniref:LPXTG-motif cell wall-anchored protein n=1 Tax=Microbacterium telephonicum TaxID=1714841 RepID=A0A498BTB8_9MICO|nr:choice-of-anchor L domain-containing protein [Microbacterium telephonicum]RLK46692.1 LPXTG-motif cell wall-anchored protein [Microbacterium telephonicum]
MFLLDSPRSRRALLVGLALGTLAAPAVAVSASAAADVSTLESGSVEAAAATLMGDNVSLVAATVTHGRDVQLGTFSGLALAPEISSGVALTTGSLRAADPSATADVDFTTSALTGPNTKATTTGDLGGDGSPELTALTGSTTYDAAQLALTVVPAGNTLSIVYQFGSEEYANWAEQDYTDALGIFVNGTLCSLVGSDAAGIGSINATTQSELFVDNTDGSNDTEMNGYTTALTCTATVEPGVETTIVAAVADTVDGQLDTTLLLAAAGITSTPAPATPTPAPTAPSATPTPSATDVVGAVAGASTDDPKPGGALARTGGDGEQLAAVIAGGLLLAAAGAGLVIRNRRRTGRESGA